MGLRKPTRYKNKEFIEFVQSQGCACKFSILKTGCMGDVVAHHTKTKGAGGSDLTCIPLCVAHHDEVHRRGHNEMFLELGRIRLVLLESFIEITHSDLT